MREPRGLHLRHGAHADRALWRSARQGPRRRSRRRPDPRADPAALPPRLEAVDEVYLGCANQAGEDNRNVARMALLLAGLPDSVAGRDHQPALRLGHGRGRRGGAGDQGRRHRARHRRRGRIDDPRAARHGQGRGAFQRTTEIYDTTIGWRFINPLMKAQYGVDSMPETGENVAEEFQVSRADQDAFALRSQERAQRARNADAFAGRMVAVEIPDGKGEPGRCRSDEHPRPDTTLDGLGEAQADRAARRHRDGRQRRRHQ